MEICEGLHRNKPGRICFAKRNKARSNPLNYVSGISNDAQIDLMKVSWNQNVFLYLGGMHVVIYVATRCRPKQRVKQTCAQFYQASILVERCEHYKCTDCVTRSVIIKIKLFCSMSYWCELQSYHNIAVKDFPFWEQGSKRVNLMLKFTNFF